MNSEFPAGVLFSSRVSGVGDLAGCLADLRFKERNESVRLLQYALQREGLLAASDVTGFFGNRTKRAVYEIFPDGLQVKNLPKIGLSTLSAAKVVRLDAPIAKGKVTYGYGIRNKRYIAGFHTGSDYAAPAGTPVYAIRSGRIEWAGSSKSGFGRWIGLRADNGRLYVYAHLLSHSVRAGQSVLAGQVIGAVGSTGTATGPHLHLEDHPPGRFVYGNTRRPQW
ncbi:peptidoglycan DD-metalloendopeptidase family protein [Streptomyces sp. NPDC090112]|uniref:peptidoglycan DD-metalloendopeptidase family protein n=1 Tax=Streptomyces sp. NPDC090112 TaxID=3365949 RepID=UPI00383053E3